VNEAVGMAVGDVDWIEGHIQNAVDGLKDAIGRR